jgi:hypothetical protein
MPRENGGSKGFFLITFEVKLSSACSFIVDGLARKPNTHTRIWKLTETQQKQTQIRNCII